MANIDKENQWYQVCINCTHSYTTKDDADTLKCRCRKQCKFDDINLVGKKK